MNMSMAPLFDLFWLTVSVVIALVASGAALAICRRVRQEEGGRAIVFQFVSALVMAAAICGMHYTGMLGMTYPGAAIPAADNALGGYFMGLPLAILCSALLGVAIFVTAIDINGRRLALLQAEQEAKWVASAAFTDANTGLANRSALEQQVLDSIAAAEGADPFALIYLDIANYREMSQSRDARSLEQAVLTVAEHLKSCLDEGVLLTRYSNSSFMLLVKSPRSSGHQPMYRRLSQLKGLKTEAGQPVAWRAGQSVYPDSGHSSRRLIRAALVNRPLSEVGSFDNLAQDPNLIPGRSFQHG